MIIFKEIKNYFELKKSNIPVLGCLLQLLITVVNFNDAEYLDAKECLEVNTNLDTFK